MIHTVLPLAPESGADSQRFAPVSNLMLALSDRCNLRCTYCFVNKTSRKMKPEVARQSVDFFLHRNITGVLPEVTISFFGGEPFLELDLMEIVIEHARAYRHDCRKRVLYCATTNGTIATPRVERCVKDSHMDLLISVDGEARAQRARPFESGAESYSVVARNLPKLMNWSRRAIVRLTYHPDNLDFVGGLSHLLSLGAHSVGLAPVVEADWEGLEERLETAYEELADWFVREARRGNILPIESSWLLLKRLDWSLRGWPGAERPCPVAQDLLGVNPDGQVMPCHRYLYRPQDWLGSVDRPKLSLARDQYLDLRRHHLKECADCPARSVCQGGCRLLAVEAGLGLQGVLPAYCLHLRAHARAVTRIYQTLWTERNEGFLRVLRSPSPLSSAISELALN